MRGASDRLPTVDCREIDDREIDDREIDDREIDDREIDGSIVGSRSVGSRSVGSRSPSIIDLSVVGSRWSWTPNLPTARSSGEPMNYRTTRIYIRALEFIDFVGRVLRKLPTGYAFLADQLRRSSASIPTNYLEGCGRSTKADRRRFFQMAIGSGQEPAGTLEVMERFGLITKQVRTEGQDFCDHLVAMLRRFE